MCRIIHWAFAGNIKTKKSDRSQGHPPPKKNKNPKKKLILGDFDNSTLNPINSETPAYEKQLLPPTKGGKPTPLAALEKLLPLKSICFRVFPLKLGFAVSYPETNVHPTPIPGLTLPKGPRRPGPGSPGFGH